MTTSLIDDRFCFSNITGRDVHLLEKYPPFAQTRPMTAPLIDAETNAIEYNRIKDAHAEGRMADS